jgi:hypothetical protein
LERQQQSLGAFHAHLLERLAALEQQAAAPPPAPRPPGAEPIP